MKANYLINRKIRERYTLSEELAILRQKETKPNEYKEYNDYCEQCKADVKAILYSNERATTY